MKKIVRTVFKRIPRLNSFYYSLSEFKWFYKSFKPIYKKYKSNKNIIFLLLSPEYGNLGDHAIAFSETELLKAIDTEYVEVSNFLIYAMDKFHLLRFFNKKNILIQGGGYIGSFWKRDDNAVKRIVKKAPRAAIYAFPQTAYYENNEDGKKELAAFEKLFKINGNFTFCAREKISYDNLKDSCNNVKLIPDMAFFLDESEKQLSRHGCLVCLRNDKEMLLADTQKDEIFNAVQKLFGDDVKFTDMCVPHAVLISERNCELEKKFDEFRSAKLVITDRLHGMIFCAITGTPCIVVNSKSPKVKGCYEWIKHLEYIKFADSISDIRKLYEEIPDKEFLYDNTCFDKYREVLKTDILNILN